MNIKFEQNKEYDLVIGDKILNVLCISLNDRFAIMAPIFEIEGGKKLDFDHLITFDASGKYNTPISYIEDYREPKAYAYEEMIKTITSKQIKFRREDWPKSSYIYCARIRSIPVQNLRNNQKDFKNHTQIIISSHMDYYDTAKGIINVGYQFSEEDMAKKWIEVQ